MQVVLEVSVKLTVLLEAGLLFIRNGKESGRGSLVALLECPVAF